MIFCRSGFSRDLFVGGSTFGKIAAEAAPTTSNNSGRAALVQSNPFLNTTSIDAPYSYAPKSYGVDEPLRVNGRAPPSRSTVGGGSSGSLLAAERSIASEKICRWKSPFAASTNPPVPGHDRPASKNAAGVAFETVSRRPARLDVAEQQPTP
jgi:hypothetical protein